MSDLPLRERQPATILSSEKFESIKFRKLTDKERALCDAASLARSLNVSWESFPEKERAALREMKETSSKGDSSITLRELKELLGEEHRVIQSLYAHRDKFERAMAQPLLSIMAALENDPVFELASPEQRERIINRNMPEPEYNELLCQLYLKKLDERSEPIPPGGRPNSSGFADSHPIKSLQQRSFAERSQDIGGRFIGRYEEKLSQLRKLGRLLREVQGHSTDTDSSRIDEAKAVVKEKEILWGQYEQRFQSAMKDSVPQGEVPSDLAETEADTRISKNAKYGRDFEQATYNSVDEIHEWIKRVHPELLPRIANRTMTEGEWDALTEEYFCEAFELKTEVATALVPVPGEAALQLVAIVIAKKLEIQPVEIPEVETVADVLAKEPHCARAIVLRANLELIEAETPQIRGELLLPDELKELVERITEFRALSTADRLSWFIPFFKSRVSEKLYEALSRDDKLFLGYLRGSLDDDSVKYRKLDTERKAMQLAGQLYPKMLENNKQFRKPECAAQEKKGLITLVAEQFLMDTVRLQRYEQSNHVIMGNIALVLQDYQSDMQPLMAKLPKVFASDQKWNLRESYRILQNMFAECASKTSTVENWQVAQQLSPKQQMYANDLILSYLNSREAMMITLNMWLESQPPPEISLTDRHALTDHRADDNA